ncbi:unnamed protein product, partial [Leptosia nina]
GSRTSSANEIRAQKIRAFLLFCFIFSDCVARPDFEATQSITKKTSSLSKPEHVTKLSATPRASQITKSSLNESSLLRTLKNLVTRTDPRVLSAFCLQTLALGRDDGSSGPAAVKGWRRTASFVALQRVKLRLRVISM